MSSAASDLAPVAVLPLLTTRRLGRDYALLSACGSTNDEVAARARAGAGAGLVIAAEMQTGGRGRRGRTWHSPAGANLYCSLLLRPALPASGVPPLTLLAGAALAQSLGTLGLSPRLKWPNDVLLDTLAGWRKVAGILTEMGCEGERVRHVIVGLGVNANSRDFPDFLARIATSLCLVGGAAVDRGVLLAGFLNAFEPLYDAFLASGPAAGLGEWRRHAVLGQPCWVSRGDARIEGVASDVDSTGALLMCTPAGATVTVHAGEVNWL